MADSWTTSSHGFAAEPTIGGGGIQTKRKFRVKLDLKYIAALKESYFRRAKYVPINYLYTEERSDYVNGSLFIGWRCLFGQFDYASRNALQFPNVLTTLADNSTNLAANKISICNNHILMCCVYNKLPANWPPEFPPSVAHRLDPKRIPLRASFRKSNTVLSTALPDFPQS